MSNKSKSLLKSWKTEIAKMGKDELQYALSFPDIYYPEYLEMVKARLEELSSVPDNEAMKTIVKKILEEYGCPYEVNEKNGGISFMFRGMNFVIFLESGHLLEIWNYEWKMVSLDDEDEVHRLIKSINIANGKCPVSTVYEIDEEEQAIYVSCTASILYQPMIFNLKQYLYTRLLNFFFAHDIINAEMTLMAERDASQQGRMINVINKQPN